MDVVMKSVGDFAMQVLQLPIAVAPQMLPGERRQAKIEHLREELKEFLNADNAAKQADALVDLIYVAAGALWEMGIDGGKAFREVHEANMRKVNGRNGNRPAAGAYDAIKPEGWVGPDWHYILSADQPQLPLGVSFESMICSQPSLVGQMKPVALKASAEEAKAQTAEELVASRRALYGSFAGRAELVEPMYEALLNHPNWQGRLECNHRHALRMIVEKIGRIVEGDPNYADNWKDIAGYAKLAETGE